MVRMILEEIITALLGFVGLCVFFALGVGFACLLVLITEVLQ